jgi:hypothetical protein
MMFGQQFLHALPLRRAALLLLAQDGQPSQVCYCSFFREFGDRRSSNHAGWLRSSALRWACPAALSQTAQALPDNFR